MDRLIAAAEEVFGPFRRNIALDFGCGVWRLTRPLSERFQHVIGVDISSSMLDEAASTSRIGRTSPSSSPGRSRTARWTSSSARSCSSTSGLARPSGFSPSWPDASRLEGWGFSICRSATPRGSCVAR
ncbi:MAG: methyltransferase domain-containing protein [Gemmatimonadales bacterium]